MALQQETLTARRRIGVSADHESYKWWALSVTSLGMLLATINSGTLIIALPDLERSLHTPGVTRIAPGADPLDMREVGLEALLRDLAQQRVVLRGQRYECACGD